MIYIRYIYYICKIYVVYSKSFQTLFIHASRIVVDS